MVVTPPDPVELLYIPGKLDARFLNNYFTFIPVFADVSMNCIVLSNPYSLARLAPSSWVTYLFSSSSSLLPTKTIIISSPLWLRASDIHLGTFSNDKRAKNSMSIVEYINRDGLTCNIITYYSN